MSEICVSVSGNTLNECLDALGEADFAELRLDLIGLNAGETDVLMSRCPRWIVTVRKEFIRKPDSTVIFLVALQHKPGYVDIDFSFFVDNESADIRLMLTRFSGKLIMSHHHFDLTPPFSELTELADAMYSAGADIVKIACMANATDDNFIVLHLYKQYKNLIGFCMGENGHISRIASLFLGEKIAYAAPDYGKPTAPGQFSYSQMKSIIHLIHQVQ